MQRRRLLGATCEVVFERGVHAFSVALACQRAGVSRKTFYDLFENREACLLAAFEEALAQAARAVLEVASRQASWTEQVRAGLTGLLSFLDREPVAARLLIVEALGAGAETLQARQRALVELAAIVDRGRGEAKASRKPPPLTGDGVVGAVFGVIHARMLASMQSPTGKLDPRPLTDLVGALMAMIVAPYLGPAAARRELDRRPTPADDRIPHLPADPFKDLPIRLTYRTARVLCSIAGAPGASSKQIAAASGITDEGQTSRLLTRLQNAGLIHNSGGQPARGEAKAWILTGRGKGVLHAVGQG
ncbi:MAG: TetR family transcriptional regulator [Solirubrobacteraceae bacterium]